MHSKMDSDFSNLKSYMDGIKQEFGVPFCRCRVVKSGNIIFDYAAGENEEGKDLYYIFSMTKLITSIAAMRLIEQGKLSLEDEVAKYLPQAEYITVESPEGPVPAKCKMTVKHLLSMQGGYNYNIGGNLREFVQDNPDATTMEIANVLLKRPLKFEPGTKMAYSLCYDVLGAVIEVASGMSLGEYLENEIFHPLGMKDTTFQATEAVKERLIALYEYNEAQQQMKEIVPISNKFVFSSRYESAGAGLISSFEDYFKLVMAVMNTCKNEEGYCLISDESLKEITKRRMTDEMLKAYNRYRQWGSGYGFGVRVQLEKDMCPPGMDTGVFELTGSAGSYAHFDLKNDIAVLYFQHAIKAEILDVVHHTVRDLVYEELNKKS